MKFIDMFCGIGTIRMGFEQAGHECVYSIEFDKHKRRMYSVIFGREPEGQDIRSIHADDLPKSDCWCFGAPCQDFSIAGQRKGLEGDRSSLVREVFRLVREIKEEYRPKYLFYENVKGMLSSNKGFDFLEILIEMESLGYDTIEYSLLNSKNFGVPQNRERVFTIGHLRNRSTRKVFPIGGNNSKTGKSIKRIAHSKYYRRSYQTFDIDGSTEALDTCQGGGRQPHVLVLNKKHEIKEKNTNEQYASCLTAGGHSGGNHSDMDLIVKTGIHGVEYQGRIRRLTPKECWRLQGIKDEITDKVIAARISDTQMYRGAGDATTVNVIYEIAERME